MWPQRRKWRAMAPDARLTAVSGVRPQLEALLTDGVRGGHDPEYAAGASTVSTMTPTDEDSGRREGGGESALLFGRYCALPRSRRLLADGQPCAMGSRAFDLLMALIEARGAILSKKDIMSRVWRGFFVDDANLRVQMAAVRRVLGSDRDVVKTIPGRGYMLAAEVATATMSAGGAISVALPETNSSEGTAKETPQAGDVTTNLRRPMDRLIGRATELDELRGIITRSRLVTLVGSGGIGKTRLAIEFGWQAKNAFPDGVWLIDLAPVADPAMVVSAAATALGVPLRDAGSPIAVIASALERQNRLLIFDNCEHLVAAAGGLIGALLERVRSLTVLATSQEFLGIPGEQVYRLNSLALPPAEAIDVAGFDAVALFIERAIAADRWFGLGPARAAAVVDICRRLDGVPLALGMAAARLPLLGVEGLRAGLGERLRVLRATPPASDSRHR